MLNSTQLGMLRQPGGDDDGCSDRCLTPHRLNSNDKVETRTAIAKASGNFHSLDPPTIRNTKPTAQPTRTLARRHLNIRAASLTCGSDDAIIEAMAQIGLVLWPMCVRLYQMI